MHYCPKCQLVYADSMQLPASAMAFFNDAYKDKLQYAGMDDIGIRFKLMRSFPEIKPEILLRGAHLEALRWINANVPKGATVLDIGCGQGTFLRELLENGFHAVGLEPSIDLVKRLTAQGLDAYHGTIEKIPSSCPQPFAVTLHFVLHHLVDPVKALASLRAKYPRASLLVTEGNFSYMRKLTPYFSPPRALTLWGTKSLRLLLSMVGYEVNIVQSPRRPMEYGVIPQQMAVNLYKTLEHWPLVNDAFLFWHKCKGVIFKPIAFMEQVSGRPPATLLAIGQPAGK